MRNLNYCRQMVKQFSAWSSDSATMARIRHGSNYKGTAGTIGRCLDLAPRAVKFMLPDGGEIYDDPELRALDEWEPIRLPYPVIAVEFERSPAFVARHPVTAIQKREGRTYQPTKALFFAEQDSSHGGVVVNVVVWCDFRNGTPPSWFPLPEVALPETGYLNRGIKSPSGRVAYAIQKRDENVATMEYADEIGALLRMLNVLNCSNVHLETSRPNRCGSRRGALPFDSYKILMVDAPDSSAAMSSGSRIGRSPREHLRRGHIVRPSGRRPYWRNACVVNAGTEGKVRKEYSVRASEALHS